MSDAHRQVALGDPVDANGYIGYPDNQHATARMMRWQLWKRHVTLEEQVRASSELALSIAADMEGMAALLGRSR